MNVRELIEHLNRIDGSNEVYLSCDSEGNGFSKSLETEQKKESIIFYPIIEGIEYEEIK